MKCPKCDAAIDYRFSTTCRFCESELPLVGPVIDYPEPSPPERRRTFAYHFATVMVVVMSSLVSTILGASATCAAGVMFYAAFLSPPPGVYDCGRANAFAVLSIFLGAFLGCTGGSVFAYRNRL